MNIEQVQNTNQSLDYVCKSTIHPEKKDDININNLTLTPQTQNINGSLNVIQLDCYEKEQQIFQDQNKTPNVNSHKNSYKFSQASSESEIKNIELKQVFTTDGVIKYNSQENKNNTETIQQILLRKEVTSNSNQVDVNNKNKRNSTIFSRISGENVFEDEYFSEDSQKKSQKRQRLLNPDLFYKLKDHQIQWNNKIFIEFMIYHILFYYLLGPFINLILFKKINLMRNLSFCGANKWFVTQFLIYALNMVNLIFHFLWNGQNIYRVEIIYMQITIFLRIFVISCKYASLPLEKIELYKNFRLNSELTSRDYYFAEWVQQSPSIIYRETYNSLQRGEYDVQMFYLSFFVSPSAEKTQLIMQYVDELKIFHKYEDEFNPPSTINKNNQECQNQLFFGYGVIYYLIKQYKNQNQSKIQVYICLIMSLIRGFSTLVYRYLADEKYQFKTNEIVQIVAIIIITTLGYFSSLVFLAYFIRDLGMKYFLLEQIKFCLQFRKSNVQENKELPTIDFTNPYALKGWSILRRVILDYGKSFFIRVQAFLTIYIIVGAVGLVLMILQIYNITNLEGSVVLVCVFEVFVILSSSLYMFYQGAIINQTFSEFKNTLVDYKVILADLKLFKDVYFLQESKDIHNILRRKSVEKLNQTFQKYNQNEKSQQVDKYLEKIQSSIEECENELDQDIINQPFTLFTIKITFAQFQSIMVALGTIAGTLFQQIIRGYQEKYGVNKTNNANKPI
ncbi:hypothetical protein ABPG74_016708 [Tetrahymena malaccensis]